MCHRQFRNLSAGGDSKLNSCSIVLFVPVVVCFVGVGIDTMHG